MAAGELLLSREYGDPYVCSANSVIEIKLVKEERDIDDTSLSFFPEYTHQFFGDSESIFGYRDLQVKLYYSAASLTTYFGIFYSEKIRTGKSVDVVADDVVKIIGERLQPGYLTNIDTFIASLPTDRDFTPYGELLHSFTGNSETPWTTYEVYQTQPSDPKFTKYHERMQTFVLWFIDAASFIDVDDERWDCFTVYERTKCSGNISYSFVGYTTVYRYYAYPANIRPRIGQMLILPPFQKKGIGGELLQVVYNWYQKDPSVVDITVEDPSPEFTRLRDFVDAKNCMRLRAFQPHNLLRGFSEDMRQEAQEKLKLNKKQARRVYEILRLRATNVKDKNLYRAYRLDVKNRLNLPFQRHKSDMKKLQMLLPEEVHASVYSNVEQRIEHLDRQYQELEAEYRHILERLAATEID